MTGQGDGLLESAPAVSFFDFGHREPHARLRARLGGKGFSLWLMRHELGLPVPPGFTIETSQTLHRAPARPAAKPAPRKPAPTPARKAAPKKVAAGGFNLDMDQEDSEYQRY